MGRQFLPKKHGSENYYASEQEKLQNMLLVTVEPPPNLLEITRRLLK